MKKNNKIDPLVRIYMDMYKDETRKSAGEKSIAPEGGDVAAHTMGFVAMSVRKMLNPRLAEELEKDSFLNDYLFFLGNEFKIFNHVPKNKAARVFAEYLLFSMMDGLTSHKEVNFSFLRETINDIYKNASPDIVLHIDELRRVFPWGLLLDT